MLWESSMRIAFITDYNKFTWIWAQNYNLFSWLKKQWLDIDIINLVSPQWYKEVPNYWKSIVSNVYNKRYLSFWYWVFYKYLSSLKKLLVKWNYTHVILWHQGLAYLWKKLQNNYKTIIIVHDLFPLYDKKKWMDEFIYNNFLLKEINKMKNIVFISEFTKKDFEKYICPLDNQNYRIIYQWIDKQNINSNVKNTLINKYWLNGKKIILNVWSEDLRKNIKTYLDVAKYFNNRNDILFVRIWRKSVESEKYIDDNKLNNVLYCSWISDEELIARYDIASIILSSSTLEWYWRQIFEGYLYDNYVVTSNVSDVKKIFDWDIYFCIIDDPFDSNWFINWVKNFLNNWKIEKKSLVHIQSRRDENSEYLDFLKDVL